MNAPRDIVDRHTPTVIEVSTDLCDECGSATAAKSYVFALLPSGRTWSGCGHHGGEALPQLRAIGAHIVDLRETIPK